MGVFKTADGRSLVGIGQQDGNEYSGFAGWRDCVIQLTASGATENSVKYLNAIKDYAIAHNAKGESIMPPNLSVWISNNGVTTAVQADDIAVDGANVTICGIKWNGTAWDYTDAGKGGGGGASSLAGLSDVSVSGVYPYDQGTILMGTGEKFGAYTQAVVCFNLKAMPGTGRYKVYWDNCFYDDENDRVTEVDPEWLEVYFSSSGVTHICLLTVGLAGPLYVCIGANASSSLDYVDFKCIKYDTGVGADNETITIQQLRLTDYDEETNTWELADTFDPVVIGKPLQVTLTPTSTDYSGTFNVPFADILDAYNSGRRIICSINGMSGRFEPSFGDTNVLSGILLGAFPGTSDPKIIVVNLSGSNTFTVLAGAFVTD